MSKFSHHLRTQKQKAAKTKKAALDNHCAAFFFLYKISHNYDFFKKIATNSMSFF